MNEKQKSDGKEDFFWSIDTDEIMTQGVFVVGSRGSGKSNLCYWLSEKLKFEGVRIVVIDSSLAWINHSNIEYVQAVEYGRASYHVIESCILDFSRLTTPEMRSLGNIYLGQEFALAVNRAREGKTVKTCFILEEAQNIFPSGSLRSFEFQETSRLITQGRNFGLSFIAITQRPSTVDTNLAEISGLHYWGRLSGERNLAKARTWVGRDKAKELPSLRVGQFYKVSMGEATLIQAEKFPERVVQAREVGQLIVETPKPKLSLRQQFANQYLDWWGKKLGLGENAWTGQGNIAIPTKTTKKRKDLFGALFPNEDQEDIYEDWSEYEDDQDWKKP